jgi:hypothetical protein
VSYFYGKYYDIETDTANELPRITAMVTTRRAVTENDLVTVKKMLTEYMSKLQEQEQD